MTCVPVVAKAEYRGGYRIRVTFTDDTAKTIDFRSWLRGPVFEPLKDVAYFQKFFLDGWTVCWPNGADFSPERLHEYGQARPVHRSLPRQKAKAAAYLLKRLS